VKAVVREVGIFLFLLLFLSFWIHWRELLDNPFAYLQALPTAPFGWLHPLVAAAMAYGVIGTVRIVIHLARRSGS